MATPQPVQFRWGIISTGKIAERFVKDLLVDPKTRGVEDLVHKVAAVGSRTVDKAKEFIATVAGGDKTIKAYGSYAEVYADKDVDAVYIGTPHTYHYENALDAIKAKKNVLCEKPVSCNSAELRSLIAAAKENNVFFMEALWTRFHPLALEVKKVIDEGALGKPIVVHADLSGNFDIDNIPTTHRILDPSLGGGALLDLGPYPLVWAIIALYEHSANNHVRPAVSGAMLKTPITGVDASTAFVLTFSPPSDGSSSLYAQAILSCSISLNAPDPGVTIRFEKGTIKIAPPIYCPKQFTVQYFGGNGKLVREETKVFEYVGVGWHFEADEVARCIQAGKLESDLWGHEKSLLEMNIFDELRKQGGYEFPPGVEKVSN
ncbi:NAD(P)-binding protein [Pleurotus eryngii]|uniref:D-xylose 1-dehydrogenase (NADP(+), D-xylono-1,5-lactone-forming) n=1 Tax=Pleurotus eryngii TaxID=5323 RepID=A0A9P6DJI1_PLEER|nr:NAD(P)-binding protein [Pleurotus eryngii]